MATSRAMLLPDRVQRVQTIKRPARTTRRWTRCLLCALPLAGFVALQLVVMALMIFQFRLLPHCFFLIVFLSTMSMTS